MILLETIRTIYQDLFTVNFAHSGYDQDRNIFIADELTIIPDNATRKIMANYEMGYRFFNDTFLCFIQSKLLAAPAAQPRKSFKQVTNNLCLRFMIKSGTSFLNKTEITEAGSTQVYCFSNRINAGTSMFISSNNMEVGDSDLKNVAVVKPEETCLGVMDIFTSNAVNNNYELFTGAMQQLRSPAYRVRFRSKV